jgi:hypothetical protein
MSNVKVQTNIYNKLYKSLELTVQNKKLTTTNVLFITTNLMKTVEKYNGIHGEEKKDLIINVVRKFVVDRLEVEDGDVMLLFVDEFLPQIIDTLILVDTKQIKIKIRKKCKSFFPYCHK